MKLIKSVVLAVAAVCSIGAQAAESYLFDNPENKTYFGARVSLDISSAANGGANYSNDAGFSAGVVYNIPVVMNFFFEPGVSMFYNTFGTSSWHDLVRTSIDETTGMEIETVNQYQIDGSIRNFGFRIPMNMGFHFDFAEDVNVSVFTGPQFNYSVTARYYQNAVRVTGAEQNAMNCSLFGTQGFNHFDLQWNFGAGLTYQEYYLGLSGSVGVTKMKNATNTLPRDLRRNIFAITLGYNF
jgi:hypothetical protein